MQPHLQAGSVLSFMSQGHCFQCDAQPLCRCAVCREEYLQGQEVALLPCSHFYHPDCIAQWLQHQKVGSAQ